MQVWGKRIMPVSRLGQYPNCKVVGLLKPLLGLLTAKFWQVRLKWPSGVDRSGEAEASPGDAFQTSRWMLGNAISTRPKFIQQTLGRERQVHKQWEWHKSSFFSTLEQWTGRAVTRTKLLTACWRHGLFCFCMPYNKKALSAFTLHCFQGYICN